VRAIGISNCYAWQLAKANVLAEREGLPEHRSVHAAFV
jgi:aryl-alcohol dehydrogenase-like predicted oxidoreductase